LCVTGLLLLTAMLTAVGELAETLQDKLRMRLGGAPRHADYDTAL